jgi:hypothetical protein
MGGEHPPPYDMRAFGCSNELTQNDPENVG